MRRDHWRIEANYLPEDLDDLAELRRRIIDAGHPAPTANGLLGWLVSKMAGEKDVTSAPTRSKYRKILAELGYGDIDAVPVEDLDPAAAAAQADQRRRLSVVRRLTGVVALVGVSLAGTAHSGASEARSEAHSGSRVIVAEPAAAQNPCSRRSVKRRLPRAA